MKTLAWILKYVILPLTPFFLGAIVRTLHLGQLSLNSLSPAELSFSMAMLSLVIAVNASRLSDPTLRDAILGMFQLGVIVSLVLFAWAAFLETDIQNGLKAVWQIAEKKADSSSPITTADLPHRIHEFSDILGRIRWVTIALALTIVPLAVYSNHKYDLEDV